MANVPCMKNFKNNLKRSESKTNFISLQRWKAVGVGVLYAPEQTQTPPIHSRSTEETYTQCESCGFRQSPGEDD